MKEHIKKGIQPLLLFAILVLLAIWNTINASLSIDLVYWMLIVSAVLSIFSNHTDSKGGHYIVQIIHLFIFLYLAWAFLIIGGGLSNTFIDYLLYILLLVTVWLGIGFTAYKIKNLMKI